MSTQEVETATEAAIRAYKFKRDRYELLQAQAAAKSLEFQAVAEARDDAYNEMHVAQKAMIAAINKEP